MAGRFKINGIWCDAPDGVPLATWLNEIVAVKGLDAYLMPTGYLRRLDLVERVRRTGRGIGVPISRVLTESKRLGKEIDAEIERVNKVMADKQNPKIQF